MSRKDLDKVSDPCQSAGSCNTIFSQWSMHNNSYICSVKWVWRAALLGGSSCGSRSRFWRAVDGGPAWSDATLEGATLATSRDNLLRRAVQHKLTSIMLPCDQQTSEICCVVSVRRTRPFIQADTHVRNPHVLHPLNC
eukprot:2091268-Amphidinium_carterae.1